LGEAVSSIAVSRQQLRIILWVSVCVASVFSAWGWFRPYAWKPDPAARCKVVESLISRDHDYFWLEVHLKVNPSMEHDLMKPVSLQTARGGSLEPADTHFAGQEASGVTDIWFKFWLEPGDLEGALSLSLNDGKLLVKSTHGIPKLVGENGRNFTTHRW